MSTTIKIAAALCSVHGWNSNRVIGHKEWTRRKIDPAPFTMDWFRARVQEALSGQPSTLPNAPILPPTVMGKGDRGSAVEVWQRQLNDTQQAGLVIDGEFGVSTEQATKAFQQKYGLKVDGLVGPATIAAMEQVYRSPPKPVEERTYEQAVVCVQNDFDGPLAIALARRYNWAVVLVGTPGVKINHAIVVGAAGAAGVQSASKTVLQGVGRIETAQAVLDFIGRLPVEAASRRGDPEKK
jgi:peptidoglycan hydrolase-like protein with peptidoglycan-binding domain